MIDQSLFWQILVIPLSDEYLIGERWNLFLRSIRLFTFSLIVEIRSIKISLVICIFNGED